MPRCIDYICPACEARIADVMCDADDTRCCPTCNTPMQQDWLPRTKKRDAQWNDTTGVHVFINEQTGEPRYPGRTDAVCPPGYRRQVMRSLREVESFEKQHNVRSEMAWYDKGSGRGFDTHYRGQSLNH